MDVTQEPRPAGSRSGHLSGHHRAVTETGSLWRPPSIDEAFARHAEPRTIPSRDPRHAHGTTELVATSPRSPRGLGFAAVGPLLSAARRRAISRNGAKFAIAFTDLVGFSAWALQVGDDISLHLLRVLTRIGTAATHRHGGTVVKSLGDGQMVIFPHPQGAIAACHQMCSSIGTLHIEGYRPQLRAGLHLGSPRRVGRDFLGVDTNVAARVSRAAAGGEVLVSGPALAAVNTENYVARRRPFQAKGAPADLEVYAVTPRR